MPFPSDEQIMKTGQELVAQLQTIFGLHPGFRPAHAKGGLVSGVFTPSAEASKLSTAVHFNNSSTPVTVRFSSSTGFPNISDTDPNANPRGVAIRFNLGQDAQGHRLHTDIIGHSVPLFPVRTGEVFLEFLRAVASSPPDAPSPTPIEKFLSAHPTAQTFVEYPKPTPSSYARETYFSVNAFKLIDEAGEATTIRYQLVPELGVETLDEAALKDKDPDFLLRELEARLEDGPAIFKLVAQVAEEGDVVDDATARWPDSRPLVELGTLRLHLYIQDSAADQKYMIFDPIPRLPGVEPSADPLLEVRAALYLISGKERRAAL